LGLSELRALVTLGTAMYRLRCGSGAHPAGGDASGELERR